MRVDKEETPSHPQDCNFFSCAMNWPARHGQSMAT